MQARALVLLAGRLDVRLSRGGTRVAVEFIKGGRSGTSVDIGRGLRLSREFDELRLGSSATPSGASKVAETIPEGSRCLSICTPSGEGKLELAGRWFRVRWSRTAGTAEPMEVGTGERVDGRQPGRRSDSDMAPERYVVRGGEKVLPLEVRGWVPGDRIRLPHGSRKLKRLFGDRRVPLSERGRIPVLSDRSGRILWVWGVARAVAEDGNDETLEGVQIEIDEIEQTRGRERPR